MLLSKRKRYGELPSRFSERGREVLPGILRTGTAHFDFFRQSVPVLGIPGGRVGRVEETGGTASPLALGLGLASLGIDFDFELAEETHVRPAVGQVPRFFVHGGNKSVV